MMNIYIYILQHLQSERTKSSWFKGNGLVVFTLTSESKGQLRIHANSFQRETEQYLVN